MGVLAKAFEQDKNCCPQWTPTRMQGVIDRKRPVRYWGMENLAETPILMPEEKIRWDIVYDDVSMAPWTCPCTPSPTGTVGEVIDSLEIEPGYLKLKIPLNPCKLPKRYAGQTPWAGLTPAQQLNYWMVRIATHLERSISLREEHMLWTMLRNARYFCMVEDQLTGKLIAKNGIDFKRSKCLDDHCLDWADKDYECIMQDIRAAGRIFNCEGGGQDNTWIMGWAACDAFMDNKGILERMKCTSADYKNPQLFDADINFTPGMEFGNMEWMGRIGRRQIWCMSDFWICSKTKKKNYFVEPDEVIMIDRSQSEYATGVTPIYGAIMDCDSMEPLRRFYKSWKDPDAGLRYANAQSAPIIAMLNANATMRCRVKGLKFEEKDHEISRLKKQAMAQKTGAIILPKTVKTSNNGGATGSDQTDAMVQAAVDKERAAQAVALKESQNETAAAQKALDDVKAASDAEIKQARADAKAAEKDAAKANKAKEAAENKLKATGGGK